LTALAFAGALQQAAPALFDWWLCPLALAALAAFCGPQQSFISQHAVPVLQHAALSGWSQQYFTLSQQRVLVTQQEAVFEGAATAEPTEADRASRAARVAIRENIL
jgi:hypothetical protein